MSTGAVCLSLPTSKSNTYGVVFRDTLFIGFRFLRCDSTRVDLPRMCGHHNLCFLIGMGCLKKCDFTGLCEVVYILYDF